MSKRKWSQSNLAHAFKVTVETALRDAGLLPELSEPDAFLEELTHQFRLIQIPQRKITDMSLLQAPILEDENEANSNLPPRKVALIFLDN